MKLSAVLHQVTRMSVCEFAEKSLVRLLAQFVYVDALKCMVLTTETVNRDLLTLPPGYEECFLREQECLQFLETADTDMKKHLVRQIFAKGDACHALLKDGDLASYGWYTNATSTLPSLAILSFDRPYVYMYQGYTAVAHRGQSLHGIGMARALLAYSERGHRGIVSVVDARNYESLRSIHRLGYKIFGRIYIIRWREKYLVWKSNGCRKYKFDVHIPNRPQKDGSDFSPRYF
ncbi:MAG: GNAT family acetyltransferase [Rhodospirillaceae bacterium]|jgi:hypothetical protein|nr:GNAT family acetyltransferase [Rhodospirillaceae bacterium]MBT5459108.1 GNAT family acetyltransferase [Rhodospirillaceae bacterium]